MSTNNNSVIDTNINNYSLGELMAIIDADDLDVHKIVNSTNFYISKYSKKKPDLANFFIQIQQKLINYANEENNLQNVRGIVDGGFGGAGSAVEYDEFTYGDEIRKFDISDGMINIYNNIGNTISDADELDEPVFDNNEEFHLLNPPLKKVDRISQVGGKKDKQRHLSSQSQDDISDVPDKVQDNSSLNMREGFDNLINNKQVNDWYQNEVLQQSDENQKSKITSRKQKIQLFADERVPMNREQIATTDTYNLPVKQDTLNPNLKNTISRFVNLDSQFRQYTNGIDSISTNYTLDLSDTLKNALNLRLYSYQIPFSWYTIDSAYGNTCFWIYDFSGGIGSLVPVNVASGNYNQIEFINELKISLGNSGFNFSATDFSTNFVSYNSNNGKITLNLIGGLFIGSSSVNSFIITTSTKIIFFDFANELSCGLNCSNKSNHYFNNTLGWIMGFRLPYYYVDTSGLTSEAIMDLNGTKYLILVIDDYNQNHVNNSLVSISQFNNTLKIPEYYSNDLVYTCLTPKQQGNNLDELMTGVIDSGISGESDAGLLIAGKYQQDYTTTQIILPSAPRTLTKSQIYTINSINSNNNNLTNYLAKAPTSSDILAIIPVKTSVGNSTGTLLVEFSGSLQENIRTYFGPVNIDRMAIKLLDDKGNILNLNGNDWCCTLVCECLYQY